MQHVLLNGIVTLSDRAFYGCSKLCCLEMTDTATQFGEYIFADCDSVTSFDFYERIERKPTFLNFFYSSNGC